MATVIDRIDNDKRKMGKPRIYAGTFSSRSGPLLGGGAVADGTGRGGVSVPTSTMIKDLTPTSAE